MNLGHYELRTFGSADELAEAAAADWLADLATGPAKAGTTSEYHVAFSGGRIARNFCRALAKKELPTKQPIHFFWADERCVPPTDAESNYRLISEELLIPARILPDRIHRIRGEMPPTEAEREAEAEMKRVVPVNQSGEPVLDMIFLGMGEDGHVASLFPPVQSEADQNLYRAVTASKPPPNRITVSYGVIAVAKSVWVLASGTGKAEALAESLKLAGRTPLAEVIRRRKTTKILTDFGM